MWMEYTPLNPWLCQSERMQKIYPENTSVGSGGAWGGSESVLLWKPVKETLGPLVHLESGSVSHVVKLCILVIT